MNGPDKPTEKLERLIDLGEMIIADLKALTTWQPSAEAAPEPHPEDENPRDPGHEPERRRRPGV